MGFDGRRPEDVEVVLPEGDAHRSRDARHGLAKCESSALPAEQRHGLRTEVHDGDNAVLCRNAARIAAHTALPECGNGLYESAPGVVNEQLVVWRVRTRDQERFLVVSACARAHCSGHQHNRRAHTRLLPYLSFSSPSSLSAPLTTS